MTKARHRWAFGEAAQSSNTFIDHVHLLMDWRAMSNKKVPWLSAGAA